MVVRIPIFIYAQRTVRWIHVCAWLAAETPVVLAVVASQFRIRASWSRGLCKHVDYCGRFLTGAVLGMIS